MISWQFVYVCVCLCFLDIFLDSVVPDWVSGQLGMSLKMAKFFRQFHRTNRWVRLYLMELVKDRELHYFSVYSDY